MPNARTATLALFAALALALPQAALGADDAKPVSGPNVLLTMTVGSLQDGKPKPVKSYSMVVAGDESWSKLTRGSRVPIPATSFNAPSGEQKVVPITSFTYQNVGFSARVRARVSAGGRVVLEGSFEDSSIAGEIHAGSGTAQPIIATVNYEVSGAVLVPGRPLRLVGMDEPQTGENYLDIEVKILD